MIVVKKPATKERKGINPFTKEPTVFKAKPARKVVKATPREGGQGRHSVARARPGAGFCAVSFRPAESPPSWLRKPARNCDWRR